jgi:mRNA interferase RelE/StbE
LAWTVEYDPRAQKDLEGLDRTVQREIIDYIDTRIAAAANPRQYGKMLRHGKHGLWRYRVRDYRIICQIQESRLTVLVVSVGHRSRIYC